MNVEQLQYHTDDDFDEIKEYIIEHKAEFKTRSLSDTLIIRGIGEKYMKI